MNKLE